MPTKTYTAQEMREMADYNDAAYARNPSLYSSAASKMLRYAAEVLERCKAEIAKLPYPPNADDVYMFKRLNHILRGDAGKEKK